MMNTQLMVQDKINNLQKEPMAKCFNCGRCKDGSYCNYFQQPIRPNYNRCFNHTIYKPKDLDAHYISPSDAYLNQLIEESERKQKKLEKEFAHLYKLYKK